MERANYYGFTLIELMVTLVVAAILTAILVPSFRLLIQSTNLTTNSNNLVASLSTARSEAIKQGIPVKVETTSGTTNWSSGWQVVKMHPNGTACSANEDCLIKTFSTLKSGYAISLRDQSNSNKQQVTYQPSGMLKASSSAPLEFLVCASGYSKHKLVQIDETGRPSTVNVSGSCP